ncbi:MAG: hypothetical protein RML35_15610 [Chloroherpetonaceae bacterium]|nr:hypothetical protein [Chloroherpetonaceae bacterium]
MMRLRYLPLFLLLLSSALPAQTVDWIDHFQNSTPSRFSAAVQTEILKSQFDVSSYLASKVLVQYQVGVWRAQATLNNNFEQSFLIEPEPITISLPQNGILVRPIKPPQDVYRLNFPLSFTLGLQNEQVGFSLFLAALMEKLGTHSVRVREELPGFFNLDFEPLANEQQSLLAGLRGYASLGNFRLHLGVMPTPILRFRKIELPYQYHNHILPFGELEFLHPTFRAGISAHLRSIGAFYLQNLPNPLPHISEPIQLSVRTQRSISRFGFQSLQLDLGVPLTTELSVSIGFERVWYHNREFNRQDFYNWLNTAVFNWTNSASNLLQEQSFRVGAVFKFGAETLPVIKLSHLKLLHRNIFQLKREYYANNPIAIATLHNADKRPVWCQIVANLGNTGRFKSEPIQIDADELRDVPIYLYLSGVRQFSLSRLAELTLSVEVDNRKLPLASVPITVLNETAWDGDTWSLKFFVAPNDPEVQRFAKSKYLKALCHDSTTQLAKFETLRRFIAELGREMRYVPDATTSLLVNQVQSPQETIEKKSGDCEDLVVYLASCLMSVGISCAILDVRPRIPQQLTIPTAEPGAIGHLFLLVDTGIDASQCGALGLTEFEAVSRPNAWGKATLWLPIEATLIAQGFNAAHRSGAQLYYHEVVEKQGIVKGNVHIYDF